MPKNVDEDFKYKLKILSLFYYKSKKINLYTLQQKLEDYSEVDEGDIDGIPIGSTVRYIKWDAKNNCERFILGGNIIRISNEYIVIQGKDNGTFSAQRYTRDKNGKIIHTTRFFKLNDPIDKYKARIIELEAEVKKLKETIRKLR